jgi:succinate dehydrogenase/fumarate reductase flavoprotein subunit
MRSIEDLSMIEYAKIMIHAMLARKASSVPLGLNRLDYPELDPPEWDKYITLKPENEQIRFGELPQRFWGDMKKEYEAHNKDYTGVYAPRK